MVLARFPVEVVMSAFLGAGAPAVSKSTDGSFSLDDLGWHSLGPGVKFAVLGSEVLFRVPRTGGERSKSGKMVLTGSSGGWRQIGETDLRVNLQVGRYAF